MYIHVSSLQPLNCYHATNTYCLRWIFVELYVIDTQQLRSTSLKFLESDTYLLQIIFRCTDPDWDGTFTEQY